MAVIKLNSFNDLQRMQDIDFGTDNKWRIEVSRSLITNAQFSLGDYKANLEKYEENEKKKSSGDPSYNPEMQRPTRPFAEFRVEGLAAGEIFKIEGVGKDKPGINARLDNTHKCMREGNDGSHSFKIDIAKMILEEALEGSNGSQDIRVSVDNKRKEKEKDSPLDSALSHITPNNPNGTPDDALQRIELAAQSSDDDAAIAAAK